MATIKRGDGVTGAVELGPRSLALLRRAVFALEQLAGIEAPDPGKASELKSEWAGDNDVSE